MQIEDHLYSEGKKLGKGDWNILEKKRVDHFFLPVILLNINRGRPFKKNYFFI